MQPRLTWIDRCVNPTLMKTPLRIVSSNKSFGTEFLGNAWSVLMLAYTNLAYYHGIIGVVRRQLGISPRPH